MVWNLKRIWLPAVMAALMIPACAPAMAQMGHPPRPPMEREFHMHFGRWWDNPHVAEKLGLTADQQKKMNQIFQNHKLKLIDLHANLHKQEAILGPLIGADNPNESQILAQIDVVAQARANLEKEFARMLLGIRRQLTPEQWQKLKVMYHERMERMKHRWHHHGAEGPHGPMPPPPPSGGGQAPPPPQM
jgi:Spy/CpxP family protein refolding chaperone